MNLNVRHVLYLTLNRVTGILVESNSIINVGHSKLADAHIFVANIEDIIYFLGKGLILISREID